MTDKDKTTEALEIELRAAEAEIDAAYWAFTRQARAKPPSLVCPKAYERRKAIKEVLSERRRIYKAPRAESAEPLVSDVAITLLREEPEPDQLQFVTVKSRKR